MSEPYPALRPLFRNMLPVGKASRPIRILVDSLADDGLINAQMGNAREIICNLNPERFHVSTFVVGNADPRVATRPNTRLIQLPTRRQTIRILWEFLFGAHDIVFYLKASPASRLYVSLRRKWRDHRVLVGTIESQCNLGKVTDVKPEAIRLWEQTILRCDYLYSNSEHVKQCLKTEYGLDSEVIPTGADTTFFTPDWERYRSPRPRVLFVGSLREYKHPELVVEAAARFPEADFTIVGEGPMRPALEAQIVREHLGNVQLTGGLGAEKLRSEYRRADVFFFPSTFEGSPKVIVEAAACGVPVICMESYSPETVIHETTGYQAASTEQMFVFLAHLLRNAELRQTLGRAGRQHSLKFDWKVLTEKWEELFSEVLLRI